MYLQLLFEILVTAFAVVTLLFFISWARDVRLTSIAESIGRHELQKLGVANAKGLQNADVISRAFRHYVLLHSDADQSSISMLLASLFLLRHELGLKLGFFEREVRALPLDLFNRMVELPGTAIQEVLETERLTDEALIKPTVRRFAVKFKEAIDAK